LFLHFLLRFSKRSCCCCCCGRRRRLVGALSSFVSFRRTKCLAAAGPSSSWSSAPSSGTAWHTAGARPPTDTAAATKARLLRSRIATGVDSSSRRFVARRQPARRGKRERGAACARPGLDFALPRAVCLPEERLFWTWRELAAHWPLYRNDAPVQESQGS